MMTELLRLAMLVSCSRSSRTGAMIAEWLYETTSDLGLFVVDRLDLAGWELPPVPTLTPSPVVQEISQRLSRRLTEADAFLVVTQWRAKPVAFVSYGGRSGGIRATEQLRQVFAELHAVSLRDGMSFHSPQDRFDVNGRPEDAAGAHTAAKVMLNQLSWWAHALADARRKYPYDV
jgi:NAD(P)H-dependent FMN reductase